MKRLVAALVAAFALAGCTNAAADNDPDRFVVRTIDETKCILWSPYDGTGNGSQMECDFR